MQLQNHTKKFQIKTKIKITLSGTKYLFIYISEKLPTYKNTHADTEGRSHQPKKKTLKIESIRGIL